MIKKRFFILQLHYILDFVNYSSNDVSGRLYLHRHVSRQQLDDGLRKNCCFAGAENSEEGAS